MGEAWVFLLPAWWRVTALELGVQGRSQAAAFASYVLLRVLP